MRSLVLAALSLAALASTATTGQAADGCGRGWFWNGYSCAPRYAPPPYRMYREDDGPRYYAPRAYGYDRGGYDRGGYYGPRGGGRPTWNGCPHGYTVQDGECKPYRGY